VSEAVAQRVLDAFALPRVNLLYSAGGNLLLLVPADADKQLTTLQAALSRALLDWSGGELDQALAWATVEASALRQDIRPALDQLRAAQRAARGRPFASLLGAGGSAEEYVRLFAPIHHDKVDHEPVADFDGLARAIAGRTNGPLYLHRRPAATQTGIKGWQGALHALSGGWCYELSTDPRPADARPDQLVDALNAPEAVPDRATGFRWLGLTTPREAGGIRDLNGIAAVTPMGRVGVLRMDVDGLGGVFGNELKAPTLAGVTALSAALDTFFAGWLNVLCEKIERETRLAGDAPPERGDLLYTIYSGGDDLFVVGAWDRLPPL
jgi:CRISPR-associated protein Csm1